MYRIGSQGLAQTFVLDSEIFNPLPAGGWEVAIFHQTGGVKKRIYITQGNSPLTSFSFEYNEKLMGAGSLEFGFLDFPLDADDYVVISYNNVVRYRAIVETIADPKGGKVKLVPYHQRLGELLINDTYTTKTPKEIVQDVIETTSDDSQILYIDSLVDMDITDTFSPDYSGYEKGKKVIDEQVKKEDDRFWGVNSSNLFKVYQPDTVTSQTFFYNNNPAYTNIKVTDNYEKVKATRYQVFKKDTATGGDTERIGQVGYGSGYPVLDIESFVRKKEEKFTVSELITSDSDALDLAYENLQVQAVVPRNIKINNFDIDRWFPEIGAKIKVQDKRETILRTIINCDSLTLDDTTLFNEGSWDGATLDSSLFVAGNNSIQFSSGEIVYNFGKKIKWKDMQKIGFMIYGTVSGTFLEMSVGETRDGWGIGTWGTGAWGINPDTADDLWNTTYPVTVSTSGLWSYVEFDISDTQEFQFFGIRFTDSTVSDINIDRIQLYLDHQSIYEQNVKKVNFAVSANDTKVDVELQEYDLQANDILFTFNKEIDKLKAISQAN